MSGEEFSRGPMESGILTQEVGCSRPLCITWHSPFRSVSRFASGSFTRSPLCRNSSCHPRGATLLHVRPRFLEARRGPFPADTSSHAVAAATASVPSILPTRVHVHTRLLSATRNICGAHMARHTTSTAAFVDRPYSHIHLLSLYLILSGNTDYQQNKTSQASCCT